MILIIALNALLALGVIVAVVSPLIWAILTQHRDQQNVAALQTFPAAQPAPAPRSQPARTRRHAGVSVARVTQPSKA